MKKLLFLTIAGFSLVFFSCKKEATAVNDSSSLSSSTTSPGPNPSIKTVPYVWQINSFVVSGTDMTSQFANYKFDIRAPQLMIVSGEIIAVNGENTYYGKWQRTSFEHVIITFSTNDAPILSELNEDWTITNNQQYDMSFVTNTKTFAFHTNGETWPGDK